MEARIGKTLLSLVTKEDVEAKARDFHPSCSMIVKVIMLAQTVRSLHPQGHDIRPHI